MMNRLTSISGNIDVNKITPSIWISQITDEEFQRVYDEILSIL
jgi:hypothetical protein